MSMEKFEESLDTDPNNADTLCNCGKLFAKQGVHALQGMYSA